MIKKSSVIYGLALSVTGFLAAALLNALIPITAPVEIVDYPVGSAFITINTAYRIVLYVLAALFLVLGLVSLRDHDKWKKFVKGAPLRFASGIGLLLWDLLGTKWQVRYGITLAADMYVPKGAEGRLPAIAVSGPFGAVKEQCSGLYAQTMAERGFITIAFDPSYTGESSGEPRYMASPDINTEDFMAAVDFLSLNEKVDPDRIGIIGICGWGGMALNTAALDPRIKATVASTMYDMTRVNANGYFDSEDSEEQRYEKKKAMAAQRLEDLKNGTYKRAGGCLVQS